MESALHIIAKSIDGRARFLVMLIILIHGFMYFIYTPVA